MGNDTQAIRCPPNDVRPTGNATKIQVPGGGWVKQGINATSGLYATQITVPDSGAPQTTLIEFGAVNFQATLAIDGAMVATKMTSFTPQVFDVTKFAKPGTPQALSVLVKGRLALQTAGGVDVIPVGSDWSLYVAQGIYRSAMIRVLPAVYISDTFVRTSVTNDTLTYDVSITNNSSTDQPVSLSGALGSWNCDALTYPAIPTSMVTVPAGMTKVITVGPIKWGLGTTSYWWPNVPYQSGYKARLHNLNVDLSVAGKATHSTVVRFGFRELDQLPEAAGSSHVYYYLNGVRVNFRGDNLQGADYDSIDNGSGKGDAYDTLPGFLPPTAQNRGWPGAVDNYEKLNYNFVRIHQELAAPYMLDTLDEMGLMAMGETAIRGSYGREDFGAGHDNMVNHAKAMVLRDRSHPAIVRWSQSNEPNLGMNDSNQFEQDLYNAINTLDGTRPISTDGPSSSSGVVYGISAPNFAGYGHYFNGIGSYSESVNVNPKVPYGQGEFIWNHDNSTQGLTWFGTSTMKMRRQDASDIRPYTLLSGWASVIPGVLRSGMTIEQCGPPVYGEDNLPDPWSSPIITRVQNGFNPVLVADQDYWEANKMSNNNGDWPTSVPPMAAGSSASRTLLIFNDTFAGTAVSVTWEVQGGSATGAIASMGTFNVDVPLGTMASHSINITAPASGSTFYLVLRAQKNGTTVFEETGESFKLN
jgi:Glycosyl hydrolases family 2, TIM barrel domain/Glycosyl hydrolases family 2, sugar binding domain/Glycosyl hydrolases family 2